MKKVCHPDPLKGLVENYAEWKICLKTEVAPNQLILRIHANFLVFNMDPLLFFY